MAAQGTKRMPNWVAMTTLSFSAWSSRSAISVSSSPLSPRPELEEVQTVIPFNVYNGSRFSGTIQTIQELEPGANVVTDGFTVSERSVAEAAADVDKWLEALGISSLRIKKQREGKNFCRPHPAGPRRIGQAQSSGKSTLPTKE